MAVATLQLTDDADGRITMALDFGDKYDHDSQAHAMIGVLAESVLKNANNFHKVEDTATEADVEPNVIVAPV